MTLSSMATRSPAIKGPDHRWSDVQSLFGLISVTSTREEAIMKYLALVSLWIKHQEGFLNLNRIN